MIRQADGKVVVMVHGLCMNDLQWNRKGHDHGAALSRDFGFTPMYLHYNSGRHTSENGRKFADLLEVLFAQFPQPIELCIVAHSMGGLVTRSACHYGKLSGHTWLKHLCKIVFLGTPHHGAPLEKGGNWIDALLEISPYSAPFARLGKIRSSGITDLRYGNVVDEDWQERDRFALSAGYRTAVPLPEGVQCYCIAGTRSRDAGRLGDDLIGDGLVTVNSALGRHQNPRLKLLFPNSHQWVGREMNHLDLLNHPKVYETLQKWVTA
jgi:pimeloyl-ACP methyl ester carboxylesterase